ncbi:probable 2-oxoglutarate-dependent dioxygenase AOP1 [Rosa rugosa]|uniref:probable 2-oxoglutarate-dependent dioxygenase AOP1 n=1 Tax=Rosa rugosa TaxID=74645 RepID=UPI002B40663A|nr:probable 2-oxoglutarate-dependent dioxygenase AOP1 [Rosa rugosa]
MTKQLDEPKNKIEMMILDSYGFGSEKSRSIMASKSTLLINKYNAPPLGDDHVNGLPAHTDKRLSTTLCDDQVSGLEFETTDGQWAWSNGRMHSMKHRVMISGQREQYSLLVIALPVEDTIVKAPKELVDEEHPQLFKDF